MNPFDIPWRRIKPGWYLLVALLVYSTVTTVALVNSRATLQAFRLSAAQAAADAAEAAEAAAAAAVPVEEGLWFPLPGAHLPDDPAHLPNAVRAYRKGVSQGFDFYGDGVGIPIPYGAPVIAAASGTLLRVDRDYRELDPAAWKELLDAVEADGADEAQLDRLRGRQIWLRSDDGRILRYAHLSGIRGELSEGDSVYRGEVIGYVGNSGTDDGVSGGTGGARLHFEIWQGDRFFGEGLEPDAIRLAAAELFTGP